jgi:hypothetical protein
MVGGHGGGAGAGGLGGAGAGGPGGAGAGGLGGAGAGGPGGAVGGAGGAAGGGGRGVAGAQGGEVPGCLQDLWAACSIDGLCQEDEAVPGSYCFASGTAATVDPNDPCGVADGGVANQVVSVKTPSGALCYTLHIDYSGVQVACVSNPPPFNAFTSAGYTWTDATGTVVANAQLYRPFGGNGSLTFGCGTNVMTSVCNFGDGQPCSVPKLVPQCGGVTGACPYPSDGGSH